MLKDALTDVAALGELLIDFTQCGMSEQGHPVFEANPGGAPANVLAMLCKLGKKCAFIGKVGKDSFGDQLEKALAEAGIDTAALTRDPHIPTTLAIVHTLPGGDRDFSFYRKPGADVMLSEKDLPLDLLQNCRIFHFGTLSLTQDPCRTATRMALDLAKASGAVISFDPNLRMPLWESPEDAREQILWGLGRCDILKISDNEVQFLTGLDDYVKGAEMLRNNFPGIKMLNVTGGAEGSWSYYGGMCVHEPACTKGGVIETTGAGDTFGGSVLGYVLEHGLDGLGESDLHDMLRFANTAAYIVATRRGAIASMPEREEVMAILAE